MPKTLVKAKSVPAVALAKAGGLKTKVSTKVSKFQDSQSTQSVASRTPAKTMAATVTTTASISVSVSVASLAATETKPEIRTPSKSIREKITEKMREKRSAAAIALGPIDFKVGDHAVYPSYGVGTVVAIETKEIMGSRCDFYVVMIRDTGMKVMVPKNNVSSVGLRPVISKQEATKVIEILKATEVRIDNQTWNRRYREYMEKIKTGSVYEIAEVLRDLFLLKVDKELSYGERNMLDTARKLLMKELTLAVDHEELVKEDEVRQIFGL